MTSWDMGGGGNSFPFDNIGDHVSGKVLDLVERQQTDMDSGQPAFWDNGDKKMMSIVTLQTELRDPNNPGDDGQRTVALMGSKKAGSMTRMSAVLDAIKAATGAASLQYGATLTIQYVGDGTPTRKGFNAPKQYQAWYQPPAMELDQPAEHKAPPPQAAAPQFGSQADPHAAGPPPAWAQQPQQTPPQGPPAVPPQAQQPPAAAGPPPGVQQQPPAPAAAPAQQPMFGEGAPPVAPPQQPAATPPAAQQQAATPAAQPVTREQVAALRNVGVDPAVVYGADWEQRLTG